MRLRYSLGNMKANSIIELGDLIRIAPPDKIHSNEFTALRSLAFTALFPKLFDYDGPFSLERGADPPDYCLTAKTEKVSIEVTSFTTGKTEIYGRERHDPGLYTSTLRSIKPDTQFWNGIRSHTLPDDSLVNPHGERGSDLDGDYYKIASTVLRQKLDDLEKYRTKYWKSILLVRNKLSEFSSVFNRRTPFLTLILGTISTEYRFDNVVLVDGNSHGRAFAIKL